ncbi:MAG: hypothetical protein ABI305_13720 [Tepidiformaceae bacterium]
MTQSSEGPRNMRRGASEFSIRSQGIPQNDPNLGGRRTSTGHRILPMDSGTVALATTGFAFYWMMPMLSGRRKKRRAKPAATTTAPPTPDSQ